MSDPLEQALALWGLEGARCTFIAGRENRVYEVADGAFRGALRFKRPGYRSAAELRSELNWMAAMGAVGVSVPRPVPSQSGALLEEVGERQVDLLDWCSGTPMAPSPRGFLQLGQAIARLHLACDAWERPFDFTRPAWDVSGLVGEAPLWGRFWDNPTLDTDTRSMLAAFRHAAGVELSRIAPDLDAGLIHADLVADNVLVDADRVTFIDFDDGGFGFRLFELATVLVKHHASPEFDALTQALLTGYRRVRPLDASALPLFLALRAATYVGWIIPRRHEEGARARAARLNQTARVLCGAYLER